MKQSHSLLLMLAVAATAWAQPVPTPTVPSSPASAPAVGAPSAPSGAGAAPAPSAESTPPAPLPEAKPAESKPAESATPDVKAAETRPAESHSTRRSDRYQIVTQNNIFLRDRMPGARPAGSSGGGPTAPDYGTPERATVLTGIVKQDDEYIAFIEDLRTHATTQARVGDAVASGKVAGMTVDGLDFEKDGQSIHIAIGMNFEGAAGGALPPARAGAAGPAAGAATITPGPPAAAGSAADILERMRQRRLREMTR